MSCARRRLWGTLFLVATVTAPTMRVEAETTNPAPTVSTTVQHHSAAKTGRRAVRRHRRGPPGGVVYARNAILVDPFTGEVLYEKNSGAAAPIASLTKLMTDLVFLEQKPDLSRNVEVTRAELDGAGRTKLRNHEMVRLEDLLHMSLMCSDNAATRVLVRESGLPPQEFLAAMNRKAMELELGGTHFVEFTGLDQRNVSTAADIARLLRVAAENPNFQAISTTRSYDFRSASRAHHVVNTNRLLYGKRYEILGGKTGFINEAGYCVATWVRAQGHDLIAVVLGAPTNATRFADVVRLVQRTITPGLVSTRS